MSADFHDAQKAINDEQIATLKRRSSPEGKDAFSWRDPLRDFETLGQHVPVELRYWLHTPVESRLEYLKLRKAGTYNTNQLPSEDPKAYWARMATVWRDVSYIVGEELKCWARPEFVGKGSRQVIAAALNILVPPEEAKKK